MNSAIMRLEYFYIMTCYTKWTLVLAVKLNDIMPMYVELGR